MELHECLLTKNDCYKAGRKIKPVGIVVHSTGANNKTLKRYVQPDDGILGKNTNNNDWNRPGIEKCVNAFIGCTAKGTVAVYQTLPWDMRPWGCGSGNKGSYNNSHIQFEICEDNLKDETYFNAAFQEAIELCVFLCKKYDIPVSNVVSHHEAYLMGYASGHADCDHWLSKFGKDMTWFRSQVDAMLVAKEYPQTAEKPNEEKVWDFLKGKGLNDYAVAGIMGNLKAESNFKPRNLQNSFEGKLGFTDDSYTEAVDNGTYDNFAHDSAGYGICQWTYWARKESLLSFAKKEGKSIGDLETQCKFMWVEMNGKKAMMEGLEKATSVREASDLFLLNYEKPARKDEEAVQAARAAYGLTFYNTYASKKGNSLPYKVKVTADVLNIRNGAGIIYKKTGTITDRGVYTIVDEKNGWGKLKSGAGWISLAYTNKLQ